MIVNIGSLVHGFRTVKKAKGVPLHTRVTISTIQDQVSVSLSNIPLTDLAPLGVGSQQIHNLDASHQDLLLHTHVCELWGLSVDRGGPAGQTLINTNLGKT